MNLRPFASILVCNCFLSLACADDPDLKPGFPTHVVANGGSYAGWPLAPIVGDFSGDPKLEIVATATASGPLYAWHSDGSLVAGWPVTGGFGGIHFPGYVRMSPTSAGISSLIQSSISCGIHMLFDSNGQIHPGWPRTTGNYVSSPPASADLNGDGIDEILAGSENRTIYIYGVSGFSFPGWPRFLVDNSGQSLFAPYVADLDLDSFPDIIIQGGLDGHTRLQVRDVNGGLVSDTALPGHVDYLCAIADVDGDEYPEFIYTSGGFLHCYVTIVNRFGVVLRSFEYLPIEDTTESAMIAVGDMTGDGLPELIIGSDSTIWVTNPLTGEILPGWPQATGVETNLYASAPLVGDVDGDGSPDVVVQVRNGNFPALTNVLVFDRFGHLNPKCPKQCTLGLGHAGAIADIDLDGRNDIVVCGSAYISGEKIYAYDINSAPSSLIEWGQIMGNVKHTGVYWPRTVKTPCRSATVAVGTVRSGNVDSARRSDDVYLKLSPDYNVGRQTPPVSLDGIVYVPDAPYTTGSLVVEGNGAGAPVEEISVFKYSTNSWVTLSQNTIASTDSAVTAVMPGALSAYMDPQTRSVHYKVNYSSGITGTRWNVNVDRICLQTHR